MACRFETVLVIGYGKAACNVLRYVAEKQARFGYRTVCIEHEFHGISRLSAICAKTGATYEQITEKGRLTDALLAVGGPALVISAGNHYLFPKSVVEKRNLEIINFHNALLPKFPGRNAPSWAIYEGETVTGATWHYVTADVDSGAIIAQGEVPVTEDSKAYELTRDIMVRAFEIFQEFYEDLLVRHIEGRPQPKTMGARKLYYSWELPGGGVCSVNDPAESIYRMLRAMDYGIYDIFPPARIRLHDGTVAQTKRYKKVRASHTSDERPIILNAEEKQLCLALENGFELMIKLDTIQ